MSIPAALPGFDWASLDPDTRAIVRATTNRLHELERRTGEAVIEIGRGLIDTKQRLGYRHYGEWLDREFGWSDETARRFMQVATVFGENPQIVGFASPSALYALASGNVPERVREEFITKAEAGERVTHKDVTERIDADRKQRLAIVDLDTGEVMEPGDAEPAPRSEPFVPSPHRSDATPVPIATPLTASDLPASSAAFLHEQAMADFPYWAAQTVSKTTAAAYRNFADLKRVPPDRLAEAAQSHTDLIDALEDGLKVAEEMAALYRHALGRRGLRRIS